MADLARIRTLVSRCFDVARTTAYEGERQAAIDRGMVLCRKHGLDWTSFAEPPRRAAPPRPDGLSHAAGVFADAPDLETALRRLEEELERSARAVGADPAETVYDARRRNFDQACAAAKARDQAREAARG